MTATEYKEILKARLVSILKTPKEPLTGWKRLPVNFDSALEMVRKSYPDRLVWTCREWNNQFIFEVGSPPDPLMLQFVGSHNLELVQVNRITGKMTAFVEKTWWDLTMLSHYGTDRVCIDVTPRESMSIDYETARIRNQILMCELLEND